MLSVDALLAMDRRALMATLCAGHPIDPRALDDTEYGGISLGLPAFVERLTWKKFKKTFHRDPRTGALRGWNVRVWQNRLDEPWVTAYRDGAPVTYGHFEIVAADGARLPVPAHRGLLIDYGRGGNGRLGALSRVRDPIVAVEAGGVELLLGWSFVDLGFARLRTPSFFALVRDGALTHRA